MNVSKYANTEQLALPLTSSVKNITSTGVVFGLHSFRGIGCSRKVGAGGTAVCGLAEFEIMLTLFVDLPPASTLLPDWLAQASRTIWFSRSHTCASRTSGSLPSG